ncbi:MAG: sigma-70 family RNA polymerase sigma factor [Planctomycetaceae bacterium]
MQSTARLVTAAQRGDRDAFAELVRRYERVVVMTAWAVVRDFHAAEDIAQDSFLHAYDSLLSLRRPESFGSWLLKSTHRAAVRRSRRQRHDVPLDTIVEPPVDVAESEWHVEFQAIAHVIGRLTVHEREVIVFRYVNGLSVAEIADATDRPIGTVSKQISRALQRLREIFTGIET